jgi:hypothetical protein
MGLRLRKLQEQRYEDAWVERLLLLIKTNFQFIIMLDRQICKILFVSQEPNINIYSKNFLES